MAEIQKYKETNAKFKEIHSQISKICELKQKPRDLIGQTGVLCQKPNRVTTPCNDMSCHVMSCHDHFMRSENRGKDHFLKFSYFCILRTFKVAKICGFQYLIRTVL
jgi:hypothetical protein